METAVATISPPGLVIKRIVSSLNALDCSWQPGANSQVKVCGNAAIAVFMSTTGNPTEDALGGLQQNYLELSNVDPVRELVELIHTQRSFELNSQSIQSADQTMQTVNNLRR